MARIFTLIRVVDKSTDWQPVFGLRRENGEIVVGGDNPRDHWRTPQDVFDAVAVNGGNDRIIWDGTTF